MKVALLSSASSIHTVRWANGLCHVGHEVHVISQHPAVCGFDAGVQIHQFPYRGVLGYFLMVYAVRKLLLKIKPDVVNAHYASGYGGTARFVNYHPWVLSVWGSDVYEFPHKSPLHKWFVKKNLLAADLVASTSHCMAHETRIIEPRLSDIAITPFGVDLAAYSGNHPESPTQKNTITIGTVKTMKSLYGIDTLIEAFALLSNSFQVNYSFDVPALELRLVGGGDEIDELKLLSKNLGVADNVCFVGGVPHADVPKELAKLDIYVALSRSESFGVAVIEAGAAGRPVVVSDAGGLSEVTVEGVTGFVVPRENALAAAAALTKLIQDPKLRQRFGVAGQVHVAQHYSWSVCIETMVSVYLRALAKVN